jgi:hypothetical protein
MVPAAKSKASCHVSALVAGLPDANRMRARFGVVLPEKDCSVLGCRSARMPTPHGLCLVRSKRRRLHPLAYDRISPQRRHICARRSVSSITAEGGHSRFRIDSSWRWVFRAASRPRDSRLYVGGMRGSRLLCACACQSRRQSGPHRGNGRFGWFGANHRSAARARARCWRSGVAAKLAGPVGRRRGRIHLGCRSARAGVRRATVRSHGRGCVRTSSDRRSIQESGRCRGRCRR